MDEIITALICRAVRIGAAKSVRFKKNSVSFKISLKNMLKIKKSLPTAE